MLILYVISYREKAPGQKECESAVQRVNQALREVNEAFLATVSQNFQPLRHNTLQGFVQNSENGVRNAEALVDPVVNAGKCEAENLGHHVNSLVSVVDSLVGNVIGASSNIVDTNEQVRLLDNMKTILESAVPFICAAKESGGNPKAVNLHPELQSSAEVIFLLLTCIEYIYIHI